MAASEGTKHARTLNFNIGVLGHVDSGKTSLSRALSTVASTASFDKNPQSRERGITLDLGFSSFSVDLPEHIKGDPALNQQFSKLQYTLVDCPGHASLIKTIIGGAQIIDLMMLVIDISKGIQTQTAECLVIGQITCPKMVVVLNKIDTISEDKRQTSIGKMTKKLHKTLESTRFADCPIVAVSANPSAEFGDNVQSIGIDALIHTLGVYTYKPRRTEDGDFLFAVDHCFSIRGQGTVMTGTVLQGSASVNDTLEITSLKVTKKVKSMQMFRQSVDKVMQGDRAGICVTQFDPKQLERGLVCSPGALPTIFAGIISVNKIPYYKGAVSTKSKFHITIGHETVMGRISLFSTSNTVKDFDFQHQYRYEEELTDNKDVSAWFALVEFEKAITCPRNSLVIGSRLDTDIHTNQCRIAFHGNLLEAMTEQKYTENTLPKLKVYKIKGKEGLVERMMDEYTVIGRSLFKKESNISLFTGLKVMLSTGEAGTIESGFGQSGKFKIRIPASLSESTKKQLESSVKKKGKSKDKEDAAANQESLQMEPIKITLTFKRYIYDPKKEMIQS